MKTKSKVKTYVGKWRSDAAETRFRELEEEQWQRVEPRPELIEVETSFGTSAVYRWPGESLGTPIVFIHGVGDVSLRWAAFAQAIEGHDCYAIDVMGDVGRSEQRVGFTDGAGYATWMDETLAGLGLGEVHLVGMSLGGYIALQAAAQYPNRAASVVLYDPVGIVDLRLARFMAWGAGNAVAAASPPPIRARLARRQRMPLLADKGATKLVMHAQLNHPIKVPPLEPLSDELLANIDASVYLVTGAKSCAFDADAMVARAEAAIAECHIEVLADAGHALNDSHFEPCLRVLRSALGGTSG